MEKIISVCAELRAESQGDKFQIAGYAALFNSPSKNLGGFVETIAPSAFDRALREKQVVRFTFNHSMDAVLARSDNGTLKLATDKKGLRFTAQLNKNIQQHKDIFEACKAGLYNECSFAFVVAPAGQKWSPDHTQRTLLDVDLLDCSLVAEPAYPGTSAAARSAASTDLNDLRARVPAMPGDWARQERAYRLGLEIAADQRAARAVADSDDEGDDPDEEMDSLRSALADHFGKASHGHTPKFWPVELKGNSVIASDMDSYDAKYVAIPCKRDDEGNFSFGDPDDGVDYDPTGRAIHFAYQVRTAKSDAELKTRMRAAAGIGSRS
jgi:HK97 family phage prohead protease